MTLYVIADIRTGKIIEDEYFRERVDALDGLRNYDPSVYTVMEEEEADKINENYITELLCEDIEEDLEGLVNPNIEDKIDDIKEEILEEAKAGREAEEEGWYGRQKY